MIWDPYLDDETVMALKKDNILSSNKKPDSIELAFVCVYHKEVLGFLDSYNGHVFDFRKLNKKS
jgi:hypothetical protein